MEAPSLSQMLIAALVAGILAQVLGSLLRLPSIVFLLTLGIALGPDGIGAIDPKGLGRGLELIVQMSVAIILFEGSMTLQVKHIVAVQKSVRRLITIGVLITFIGGAAAAHLVAGLPLKFALLFGALVTVTGPTVIRPIVRGLRMRREMKSILESEGILADPIGAILAVVCLELALTPEGAQIFGLIGFLKRLGAGIVVGGLVGVLLGLFIRFRTKFVEHLKNLIVMACVLGCYQFSEHIASESGIMAVVAAGLAIQHGIRPYERQLREFKEQLTTLLLSVLFILLSANLSLNAMRSVGWTGLATVLILMIVVRPLNVFLCTRGAKPTFREKLFLSWTAPRGIVAASVASLAAIVLARAEHTEGSQVEALVFLTIFLTVFFQGGVARPLAKLLGITAKEAGRIIVVGGNPVGVALANGLRGKGRDITFIDRNLTQAERARAAGFFCVTGDATERDVLRAAQIEDADSIIVVTGNTDANQRIAYTAKHDYDVHEAWIALNAIEKKTLDPLLKKAGAEILFGRPIPMESWEASLRSGEARIVEVEVPKSDTPRVPLGKEEKIEFALPLYVIRNGQTSLCRASTKVQAGDRLTLAVRGSIDKEKVLKELTT